MFEFFRIYRCAAVLILLAASQIAVAAQDLGSSNGLFRTENSKEKNASSGKKKAVKPTAARRAARKPAVRKTAPVNNRRAGETERIEKVEIPKRPVPIAESFPNEDVIITVGQTSETSFEQLYEAAIDEGNAARNRRDYEKAEAAYRRAANLNPKDARALYGLGNLYTDQQRWEEAEYFYREALKVEPASADPLIALSFVLTQPVLGREISGRFMEAEQLARRAIELDPENPFAFDQLGAALELNGRIGAETLEAYRKATELDPEFALAYAHLGRLLRRTGKKEESAAAYGKAIAFSKDVPTMILVADVLQSEQRFADSERLLRRALAEDAKNPTGLFLLGRALTARGAFDEAETILKTSLEISPNSFVSYVMLGSLYQRRGELARAENILKEALKVISENEKKYLAQAFEAVGDDFLKIGKKIDAARAYRQAIALDSQRPALSRKLERLKL